MKRKPLSSKRLRRGLTLIELVMVLIILVALTALVVPIVDSIRRTSDKSTGAAAINQVVQNVSLYRTMKGNYPNRFDSLLDGGGSLYSDVGFSSKLTTATLNADEAASLTKAGINTLMDHDLTNAYRGQPGNSGVVPRDLASSAAVAVITDDDIINSMYPGFGGTQAADGTITLDPGGSGGDPQTVKLVALGIGPNSEAVGQTMVSAPAYQGVDGLETYNRMIAVFAVYDGFAKQKRCQIKGALDSKGDFLNQELNEVTENEVE